MIAMIKPYIKRLRVNKTIPLYFYRKISAVVPTQKPSIRQIDQSNPDADR